VHESIDLNGYVKRRCALATEMCDINTECEKKNSILSLARNWEGTYRKASKRLTHTKNLHRRPLFTPRIFRRRSNSTLFLLSTSGWQRWWWCL